MIQKNNPQAGVSPTEGGHTAPSVAGQDSPRAGWQPASRMGGQFGGDRRSRGYSGHRGFGEKSSEFDSKLLDLARISHTRAGGKKMRFRAVIVSGNNAGKVGVGAAKGSDVAMAIDKATRLSKKNMIEIPIVENTIPHDVLAKYGAARVLLRPQKKGRGLVAGGTVRVICNLVGIKDISSKILGKTGNKLSNAMATIKALQKLKVKNKEVKKTA